MKSPIDDFRKVLELDEAISTQDIAAAELMQGNSIGAVWAHHQTGGRGRFGRSWVSPRDSSLTVSFICSNYADHPRPYLVGMAIAIAVAEAIDVNLQWPNDLVLSGKKVAGVLTEIVQDNQGRRIPIVGVGINLNQIDFPSEICDRATSLRMERFRKFEPKVILDRIVKCISEIPEPHHWSDLSSLWSPRDKTQGKNYRTSSGDIVEAISVGPDGELIAVLDGLPATILAADAIFGIS